MPKYLTKKQAARLVFTGKAKRTEKPEEPIKEKPKQPKQTDQSAQALKAIAELMNQSGQQAKTQLQAIQELLKANSDVLAGLQQILSNPPEPTPPKQEQWDFEIKRDRVGRIQSVKAKQVT